MIETPKVVETPAEWVATLHIETPRSKMQQVMGPGIGEVMAAVKAQGIGPTGPWFAHHLSMTPDAFNFDICVPVASPVTAVGRVKSWQRPVLRMVCTTYHGPYEGLGEAWREFTCWIDANGYPAASDLYERYVVGPESGSDAARWRTELSRALN